MKRVVRYLRKQPEHTRVRILYILTVASGLILLIVWANVFGINTENPNTVNSVDKTLAPFAVLKDNITEGAKSLQFPQ